MNAKLDAVASQAADMLASAIRERNQDILDAWEDVTKEAHESDKEAILSLSYGIKLDLVHNRITTTLGFSVRRKHEQAAEIEDPNQPALGFHEDSATDGETKQ